MRTRCFSSPATDRRGVALIITLAFVVLLTVCIVAFFSRAISERQVSTGSASQTKVEIFAQGAADTIIGDLKQEIAAGSVAVAPSSASGLIYKPASPLTMVPCRVGQAAVSGTNLLKQSLNTGGIALPFYSGTTYNIAAYPPPQRASLLPTDTLVSLNGRSISQARWNMPLLLPVTSSSNYTPQASTGFTAPDWILVERSGSNPIVSSTNTLPAGLQWSASNPTAVVGRYAYNIYDEGGLLDMNVAGYPNLPTTSSTNQFTAFKSALAYADLTQVGLTQAQVNTLVGWRNNGSTQVTGSFPSYSFPAAYGTNYYNYVLYNPNGFLGVSGTVLNNNGTGSQSKGQSDRMFSSRQQLIQFLLDDLPQGSSTNTLLTTINSLQYLGTFSRDIDQPAYIRLQSTNSGKALDYNVNVPKLLSAGQIGGGNSYGSGGVNNKGNQSLDDQINPSFFSVRVLKAFTRNDGTQAVIGEPLVKRRFALNRLAWITYKGPSADVITASGTNDANIQALIRYGIPLSCLEEGTDANIAKYFGLAWVQNLSGANAGSEWEYNIHNGPSGTGPAGAIMLTGSGAAGSGLAGLSSPREPDFFELLKATINVGSLGKALVTSNQAVPQDSGAPGLQMDEPYNYNYYPENSVDYQVMQIGANIISQFQPANYPPRIVFDDGSGTIYTPRTFVGVANLPYFYSVLAGVLQMHAPAPLPRSSGTANAGTGTFTRSVYATKPVDQITNTGAGAVMESPVIWNPHDPSSPTTNAIGLSPTAIRVVADSTTPDQTGTSSGYNSFYVYGASDDAVSTKTTVYSYEASPSSPNSTWYTNPSPHKFQTDTQGDAEIDINIPPSSTGSDTLFPEPAMLIRPGTIRDLNGNTVSVSVPTNAYLATDPNVSSFYKQTQNTGLPNFFCATNPGFFGATVTGSDPLNKQSNEYQDPQNQAYIGFYMGAFPLAWINAGTSGTAMQPVSVAQVGCYMTYNNGSNVGTPSALWGSPNGCYMTYRMQYRDTGGNWVTYDTKYGKVTNNYIGFSVGLASLLCGDGPETSGTGIDNIGMGGFWACSTDPRTNRFGLFWSSTYSKDSLDGYLDTAFTGSEFEEIHNNWNGVGIWPAESAINPGWLDAVYGILSMTARPDAQAGFTFASKTADAGWPTTSGAVGATSGWMAWVTTNTFTYPGITPGLLSQNNTDVFSEAHRWYGTADGNYISTGNYFADPDGIVRRGMGAFVPTGTSSSPSETWDFSSTTYLGLPSADTAVGLPMTRVLSWDILNGNLVPPKPDPTINPYTPSTPSTTSMSGTSQAASRPYFLHRPFRSVAELGYVFSDTPWRNLDFSTVESGNAALLDVFCVNDDTNDANGLIAGKVNLNTRQIPVLRAVLAGAYLDSGQTAPLPNVTFSGSTSSLNVAAAQAVASALVARTSDTNNIVNGTGPLQNVSELVGKWVGNKAIVQLPVGSSPQQLDSQTVNAQGVATLSSASRFYDGKLSYAGFSGGVWDNTSTTLNTASRKPFVNGVENFSSLTGAPKATGMAEDIYSAYMDSGAFTSGTADNGSQQMAGYIQRFREAPIRALANAGQTRVWNLLIDVIAQTGRYPQSATTPGNFLVEGEQRYWVHVAIDRYTGQVLDKQVEVVKE